MILSGFAVVAAGCGTGDDVARIAARTDVSEPAVRSLLDDLARTSTWSSDDLAKSLARTRAPRTLFQAVDTSPAASGIPGEVRRAIACDIAAEAMLEGPDLSRETLVRIVLSSFAGHYGGSSVSARLAADEIIDGIEAGDASDPLWVTVTTASLLC